MVKWRFAVAAFIAMFTSVPSMACTESVLTGRSLEIGPSIKSFGRVQGQPPLPLEKGEYVITIDDGPNPVTTPQLLKILNDYCIKATFFLIGRNAERNPALVKQILADGQNFGSHSYTHPDLSRLSPQLIEGEITKGDAVVEKAAGASHSRRRLFRFPGSSGFPLIPPQGLLDFAEKQGLVVAEYDFSPQDWRNGPPAQSFATLFKGFGDRGVILFHDGQPNTIPLLPMVLDELKRRNAKIVSLDF